MFSATRDTCGRTRHSIRLTTDYPKKSVGYLLFPCYVHPTLVNMHRVSATVSMRVYYTHTKVPKNYCNTAHDDIVFFFSGWRIELSSCPVGMEQLDGLLHLSKGGKTFERSFGTHTHYRVSLLFFLLLVRAAHHQALRCTVHVILHDCIYERRGCRHVIVGILSLSKYYIYKEGKTHSTEKNHQPNGTCIRAVPVRPCL